MLLVPLGIHEPFITRHEPDAAAYFQRQMSLKLSFCPDFSFLVHYLG
jgi:hypothetical protein